MAKKSYAKCVCECGKKCEARLTDIKSDKLKSCGCLKAEKARERTIERNYKHGKSRHPLMNVWGNMINSARLELAREPLVWWPLIAAFIFMFTLVLVANIFSDAVRDAFDPRSRNS